MESRSALRHAGWSLCGATLVLVVSVAGAKAITSGSFTYDTVKTGYYGLSPMAFRPFNDASAGAFSIHPEMLQGPGSCFVASVKLPQNATITTFGIWYASDTAGAITVNFYRTSNSTGEIDHLADITTTNASLARKSISKTVAAADALVKNHLYKYSARVCLAAGGIREFYAGRITYSYDNAGD